MPEQKSGNDNGSGKMDSLNENTKHKNKTKQKMKKVKNITINIALVIGVMLAGTLLNFLVSILFFMNFQEVQCSPVWFFYVISGLIAIIYFNIEE